MSAIEIILLLLVLIGFVKLAFLLVKPEAWMGFARKVWSNSAVASVVALVLGVIVLKFLLTELTIVQIFASFALMMCFFWLSIGRYRHTFIETFTRDVDPKTIVKKSWLATVLWLVLSVWVLKEIF